MSNPHPLRAKVRIVLVETSHPGNIGAAARAMKNMGLDRLYLYNLLIIQTKKLFFVPLAQAMYWNRSWFAPIFKKLSATVVWSLGPPLDSGESRGLW